MRRGRWRRVCGGGDSYGRARNARCCVQLPGWHIQASLEWWQTLRFSRTSGKDMEEGGRVRGDDAIVPRIDLLRNRTGDVSSGDTEERLRRMRALETTPPLRFYISRLARTLRFACMWEYLGTPESDSKIRSRASPGEKEIGL